jgi:hypothetical protein
LIQQEYGKILVINSETIGNEMPWAQTPQRKIAVGLQITNILNMQRGMKLS